MNDNALRAPEWQRLVGPFMGPRLGGAPAAWAEANRRMARRLFGPEGAALRSAGGGVAELIRISRAAWLHWMCDDLGLARPPGEQALILAGEATAHITRGVRAACPGAPDAILRLHADGFLLHTASGEASDELDGYLTGMGVRHCFGRLYGPDLIGTWKEGPEYHARILHDAGVYPTQAVVVDDSPDAVAWAASTGATALLVAADPPGAPPPGCAGVIATLADLPAWLAGHRG